MLYTHGRAADTKSVYTVHSLSYKIYYLANNYSSSHVPLLSAFRVFRLMLTTRIDSTYLSTITPKLFAASYIRLFHLPSCNHLLSFNIELRIPTRTLLIIPVANAPSKPTGHSTRRTKPDSIIVRILWLDPTEVLPQCYHISSRFV